ncbi:6-pyruvoyl trahydropterin synthase family protein [Kribbella italica]|uniref:6-carboxy-5,6,7,8-tetrahydropterin synthase n=1 Tax=Kribbella italica TaxID=1540520 RepID=A0A7W9MZP0_9ACTN|nr:6-carboxytetrahydropterin synthase [Kribbella italica]MBB5841607.1 6-pyruvoyltetrahydropterin/6-carboxytetrahydropterin synthase [Kribbella italica]
MADAVTHAVTIRHNFETAHRLPQLGGKCQNLHGHSWWTEVTVSAPAMPEHIVIEFGAFKRGIRQWIDTYLDHGTMLGADDPLVPALQAQGSRLYRFGAANAVPAEKHAADLAWPTVESVAVLLGRVGAEVLAGMESAPGARITAVRVEETSVNAASWTR